MIYNVTEICKDVRIALDKNDNSEMLLDIADTDSISIDELIRKKLEEAARIVEIAAPVYLLDEGKPLADSVGWQSQKGYGSGFLRLPEDFMRLVVFQMSDWAMPVSVAISADTPLYAQQKSRFAGVRGNPQQPVVAVVPYPSGMMLEFYCSYGGESVHLKYGRYLPVPKIDDEQIELCAKLYPSVVNYAAFLVAQTLGETELADRLLNMSKELMK